MSSPDPHAPDTAIDATERRVDSLLRAGVAVTEGMTWDDIALLANAAPLEDGLTWDDTGADLAAMALLAAGSQPIPADVANRHLQAMHTAFNEVAAPTKTRSSRGLSWRRRLASVTAAFTALAGTSGGAVAFAQDALPGDALYGVKRASEQVRLLVEMDATGDAALHLSFAERRLAELAAAPDAADDLAADAFDHLAAAEAQGDASTRAQAQATGMRAVEVLTGLLDGGLPESASPKAREALERARDRKAAHEQAKAGGAKGRDQAPGQQKQDDAPGKADNPANGTTGNGNARNGNARNGDAGNRNGGDGA